jgi:hypothetical protein
MVGALLSVAAVSRCVGDSTSPSDGGDDATASDVSTQDVTQDTTNVDAGSDASATSHVYVASFGAPSQPALVVFDVPLTSTSQPSAVITANFKSPADVEVLAATSQIVVIDPGEQKALFFNLPITSASTPAIAIALPFAAFDSAFDSKGNMWVVGTGNVGARYAPPFTASSQPAQTFTIPNATLGSFAIGFNKLDGVFVGSTATNQTAHVYGSATPFDAGVLATTVDNTNVDTPTGIVFGSTSVFVSDDIHGIIDQFALPFTSAETPTAVGGTVLGAPARLTFAANGNLVVADAMKGLVVLQAPNLTTALVTIPNQLGDAATPFSYRSVAIGP